MAVVGGGAASLMFAACIDTNKFDVVIYERNNAPGRKFLVAGDGGFNLTHSEPPQEFIRRYTPSHFIKDAFERFNNADLVNWLHDAGIPTRTGSSGRVFPTKEFKPIEVLNVFLKIIRSKAIQFKFRHQWLGFLPNGALRFQNAFEELEVVGDHVVFALGGASWPVTGSAGEWRGFFEGKGINTRVFEASNCTMHVHWPEAIATRFSGEPLKNIKISCAEHAVMGEVIITEEGLEGSGIYPLSPLIRAQLNSKGAAEIQIDLKPALTKRELLKKISASPAHLSQSDRLRKALNLNALQMELLKHYVSKKTFLDNETLVAAVKALPLRISGMAPVKDAISTVGGIMLEEIDKKFMLKKLPDHYVIGEMLDYDAPTGGYLLQSCFSMGKFLAEVLNKDL